MSRNWAHYSIKITFSPALLSIFRHVFPPDSDNGSIPPLIPNCTKANNLMRIAPSTPTPLMYSLSPTSGKSLNSIYSAYTADDYVCHESTRNLRQEIQTSSVAPGTPIGRKLTQAVTQGVQRAGRTLSNTTKCLGKCLLKTTVVGACLGTIGLCVYSIGLLMINVHWAAPLILGFTTAALSVGLYRCLKDCMSTVEPSSR